MFDTLSSAIKFTSEFLKLHVPGVLIQYSPMEIQKWLIFFTMLFLIRNVESANPSKMFVFGDSYADTGNQNKSMPSWRAPYGTSFPGHPSGRYSDGRVLTDFVASYFNLTSPVSYELRNYYYRELMVYGINFAYGGTGVFDTSNGLPNMTAQINLLQQLVQEGSYSFEDLSSSLVLVSVAGNDYANRSYKGIHLFVKILIKQLSVVLLRLYNMGIRKVAVSSLEPLGCLPFATVDYSYTRCNDTSNKVAVYHNLLLQKSVQRIRKKYAGLSLVVLDQYTSFMSILSHPQNYGNFDEPVLKPCCTGKTNRDYCGSVDKEGNALYNLCSNPSSAFFWDILHPAQAAWHATMTSFEPSLNSLKQ